MPELDMNHQKAVTVSGLYLHGLSSTAFDAFVCSVSRKAQSQDPGMALDDLELCSNAIELFLDKYYKHNEITNRPSPIHVTSTHTDHEASRVLDEYKGALNLSSRKLENAWTQLKEEKHQFELKRVDQDIENHLTAQEIQTERDNLQRRESDLNERETELRRQLVDRESVHWREQAVLRCWHCGFKSHLSPNCYTTIDVHGHFNNMEYRYRPN
jgi:hypothetical protein